MNLADKRIQDKIESDRNMTITRDGKVIYDYTSKPTKIIVKIPKKSNA